LISKCFAGHPENLWITLLKTRHQGRESLKNQGFCQIAHQMGIEKYFNKINSLACIRGGLIHG
jgi:hypothetical protein